MAAKGRKPHFCLPDCILVAIVVCGSKQCPSLKKIADSDVGNFIKKTPIYSDRSG